MVLMMMIRMNDVLGDEAIAHVTRALHPRDRRLGVTECNALDGRVGADRKFSYRRRVSGQDRRRTGELVGCQLLPRDPAEQIRGVADGRVGAAEVPVRDSVDGPSQPPQTAVAVPRVAVIINNNYCNNYALL